MELTTVATGAAVAAEASAEQMEARTRPRHRRVRDLLPLEYMRRDRLVDRLESGGPIALVLGPAGTGKTVAVAGWAAELSDPVAWVTTLDRQQPGNRVWPTIADALGVLPVDFSNADQGDLALPAGDGVVRLAEHLDVSLQRDVVLVIDDYHLAEDPDLAAAMALFLHRRPERLRVVIVSRRVPQLPLDRMRVSGELCEIDVDELLFTRSEARELMDRLAPVSDSALTDAVESTAAGWVAGLRLGATELQRGGDSSGDVSIDAFDDYVRHEVLGGESDAMVEFLTDLAAVEHTTVGLAEAITQRSDVGALLEFGRRSQLLIPRVRRGGSYEIHPSVRRAVLAERRRSDPARAKLCHRRAAQWLEQCGETVDALRQWLLADEYDDALRLLAEQHIALYDSGNEQFVEDCLAQLPPSTTAREVGSLVDLAWCELVVDRQAFRRHVAEATWWSEHGGDVNPRVAQRLRSLQAIIGLLDADWSTAERLARASLEELPQWRSDPIAMTMWNNVARAIALAERWDESGDDVREASLMVRWETSRSVAFEASRALGLALSGSPVDALRVASGVRASDALVAMQMSLTELALAEVMARRELGDAPEAESELNTLLDGAETPLTYVRGLAAVELVQLHLDAGSVEAAAAAFSRLEEIVRNEVTGPGGRTWLGRMGTLLSLDIGDVDQADRWACSVSDEFWGPVSRARVMSQTEPGGVAAVLEGVTARSPRQAVVVDMLRAAAAADRVAAGQWAEAAVRVASHQHMLQTLASTGQFELIERVAWRIPGEVMDRLRRATAFGCTNVGSQSGLIEPLTVRERDVLRFLPSRLTLKEIADELFVSVNTLKFHLKVIYRKLGVNSRAEASEIARSWGRIDQT